jgi:hypothetical protein
MAIGNAVERDQFVYVYDEKGYHLSTLYAATTLTMDSGRPSPVLDVLRSAHDQ